MQVNSNVSESDIGMVTEGQNASFVVDAYPERKFWGTVTQVRNAPQTVQNVVTYDVVVSVDNTDLSLKPGMTANLSIVNAHRDNALKVPLAALRFRPPSASGDGKMRNARPDGTRTGARKIGEQKEEETRHVWVQTSDQGIAAVPVKIGISDDTYAELLEGDLKEGEKVITGIRTENDNATQPTLPGFGMRWRR
jgi:HlyD family secretion protein